MRGPGPVAGAPVAVAPLPSRGLPRCVQFSVAKSVQFSMAIDTCMGSLTPRSPAVPHLGGPAGVAFDRDYSLGTSDQGAFDAQ